MSSSQQELELCRHAFNLDVLELLATTINVHLYQVSRNTHHKKHYIIVNHGTCFSISHIAQQVSHHHRCKSWLLHGDCEHTAVRCQRQANIETVLCRQTLLEIAAAGPAAGAAASLACLLLGLGLSAGGLGGVSVEPSAFEDSLLVGLLGTP